MGESVGAVGRESAGGAGQQVSSAPARFRSKRHGRSAGIRLRGGREGSALSLPPQPPLRFLSVTAQRRENRAEQIKEIFAAIQQLSGGLAEFEFLFPVHPNPKFRQPAEEMLGGIPSVHLLPPVNYVSFVWLMIHSHQKATTVILRFALTQPNTEAAL